MYGSPVNILTRLSVTALLIAPGLALADDEPGPLAEVRVIVPREGQTQELYKALHEHLALRSEQGDPRQWISCSPLLGDDLNRIVVRSCCHRWADVDACSEWGEAHPEVGTHFRDKVAPLAEEFAHNFGEIDWANSHWNSGGGPYRYFAVTEFSVKPGAANSMAAALEKMSQTAIQQGRANEARS